MNVNEILSNHKKWLNEEVGGVRADLYGANLSSANLSGASLFRADLSSANLSGASLFRADLSGADLSRADLSGADLSRANLSGANLSGADLSSANLSGADLRGANLFGANLSKTRAGYGYFGCYFVACVKDYIYIGCQRHLATDWRGFTNKDIAKMAPNAKAYWKRYKKAILAFHEAVTQE